MNQTGYTKEVMKHFQKPHNYGRLKKYNGLGKVGNIVCGDVLWLYLNVENKNGKEVIKDVSYETYGCVAAISTSSAISDLAKGKTIENALKINKEQVIKVLGDLPPIKIHCSLLAIDALSEAIYDYLSMGKKPVPGDLREKHQKIERAKQVIEERYKKWTEKEKQK
ncbi:MAG: iron-sulfur cluster assembly scaffold protein [Candidatus Portnoybacteria bacterium RIFCSPLOWO2_01_FULL_43_11]|uniref:Iron-sulfur cluster assembly scaffold protein n=3 Tax=Candidatus Portnoyibacteriota TaxID=1817913 RepID=A0A1G2FB61_9BACT|nr:MAG: iron-sulfur cluster assembly scaffold protein [Candidatus Portnoybacteria bacterium RIFCSPHIGHO2_01_FULL_40_12b]OGZ36847.1 MAG: iron-sulfur cluster assembly scaffold protein [Candidatus Portnoybacteria bacterium RIFCSPHIGHO2_02_FULL_40_23]OGZ38245.1 MAG: iron-sulfur cluster assembly scaffold protein [Candidatus Portnoybacteria bacterium RIFCSPLOWO2_01_FULL_43_11]OGZ39228.1 MAG: iron-sulfur cluster assembly scaffold protein [Candidatus Portnoybacteria bacterium RIFCSPHIGHO2_12_FULL_40_11]